MEAHTALIIDDDIEIASLLGVVLDLVGYQCEVCHSAKAAFASLAASSPQLVLLDMRLGASLGGEDILYQVRSNPRLKDTRVIVITGHPTRAQQVAPLVDYTLGKPIDIDRLKAILTELKNAVPEPKQGYFFDPTTGMYNMDFFYARMEHAIARAKRRSDFIFGVCDISVRLVQSPGGEPEEPEVFNAVLRDATQSLVHNLRPTDTVARLSHAAFATLHEELAKPEDIKVIVRRIQTILTPPFTVDDRLHTLTFRIGTATSQDYYESAKALLELAESNIVIDFA